MDLSTIPPLRPAARERLERYVELLGLWAPRLDLVAPGDVGLLWERHISDSLRALPDVEAAEPGPCIDVGSGAGLPGIPLAIASRRLWRLLEPRRRRAAFLEEAARELGLEVEVVPRRAEELEDDLRDAHVIATARALASPAEAAATCRPLVKPGGKVLIWVGERSKLPQHAERTGLGLASIEIG